MSAIPRYLKVLLIVLLAAIVVMGFFIHRLTRQAGDHLPRAADLRPVAPRVAGPPEEITLFVAHDADGSLRAHTVSAPLPAEPNERAREILRLLLAEYIAPRSPHPLDEHAGINDVYLINGTLAVVDANPAFANGHRSGILVETLTVASLVRTLEANVSGITQVKILVDGAERETLAGHADLSVLFEPALVGSMVRSVQEPPVEEAKAP